MSFSESLTQSHPRMGSCMMFRAVRQSAVKITEARGSDNNAQDTSRARRDQIRALAKAKQPMNAKCIEEEATS
jgi:hypothetical protein